MVEWIKNLLSGEAGVVAQVITILVIVNACLSGLKVALDAIKDHTEATWDNKVADVLATVLKYATKLIDLVQGNLQHKPKE